MLLSVKSTLMFSAFLSALIYTAFAGTLGQYGLFFAAGVISLVGAIHIVYVKKITWLLGLGVHLLAGVLIGLLSLEAGSLSAIIYPAFAIVTAYFVCASIHSVEKLHGLLILKILSYFAVFLCFVSIFYPDPSRSGLWTSIFSKPNNFGLFLVTTTLLLYLGNLSRKFGVFFIMTILLFISLKVGSRAATACIALLYLGYFIRMPIKRLVYSAIIGVVLIAVSTVIDFGLFSTFEEKLARRGGFFETPRIEIWIFYISKMNLIGGSQEPIIDGLHSSWVWLSHHMGIVPGIYFSLLIMAMVKKHLSSLGILSSADVIIILLVFIIMGSMEVIFYKPFYVLFLMLLATSSKTYDRQRQTESGLSERKTCMGIQ